MQLSEAKQALHSLVRRLQRVPARDRERAEIELAEILLYLIRTANRLGIDLVASTTKRIAHAAKHQPRSVAELAPLTAQDALAAVRPPRILIVEDERIVAADLQETLNGLGYDAYANAASEAEALAIARQQPPDIALTDIRIEGHVDGIELYRSTWRFHVV